MNTSSPAWEAFWRGVGMVVLVAILTFIGNEANLSFLSPMMATYISGAALFVEGLVEKKTGSALFGLAK